MLRIKGLFLKAMPIERQLYVHCLSGSYLLQIIWGHVVPPVVSIILVLTEVPQII